MPQAAINALTTFFVGLGAAESSAALLASVFVYAASSYLLNRAAAALTPRYRSPGLGTATPTNYYGPPLMIEVTRWN